jgi:phenylpyruvate tautomerase PptA (4-oxalocrotonate tautomerase family)
VIPLAVADIRSLPRITNFVIANSTSKMPLYTIYHPPSLTAAQRSEIAEKITKIHVEITDAPSFLVKAIFIALESSSYFSAGNPESSLLRIVGVIRAGRTWDDRQSLLLGIYEGVRSYGFEVEIHLEEMKAEVPPLLMIDVEYPC